MKYISQYFALTKPRVTQLAVFCAVIGMFLASPGMVNWKIVLGGSLGIGALASAAFAINCLVERRIDALMHRTAWRASARGDLSPLTIIMFSTFLVAIGMFLLAYYTNFLTMWLTLITFFAYAIVYTLLLKPATPQNIVIGGASGAMPPALGWAAVTGEVSAEAWILVLIIFVWTPPHFWALALYRREEYANARLPVLPNTHGEQLTRFHILLYTVILSAVSLLPYAARMSTLCYLAIAILLDSIFLYKSWQIWQEYSELRARKLFRYSIWYLALLFAGLLIDHYFPIKNINLNFLNVI